MLFVFLAGRWRENRLQFFGSYFLFISANWVGRTLGWVRLNYCSDFLEDS